MRWILAAALLSATPLHAGVPEALARIGKGYQTFAAATADLDTAAQASCDGLKPAFDTAWDAWLHVAQIRIGPVEDDGRALAIAFWPDPKALGAKAQRALLTGDPAALAPERFAEHSVAARGFSGLERLLFPDAPLPADPCPLIRATTHDLARMAAGVNADWPAFSDKLAYPGGPGNTTYLTDLETAQALVTQLASALEFTADQRLGRPMGTFDQPRPERAEARASGRSLRNVVEVLKASRDMALDLHPEAPRTEAAFAKALALADRLDDPTLASVATPQGRLKVEILQNAIREARAAILSEIAPTLGVGLGFNALDGD